MYKPKVLYGHWITWPSNLISRVAHEAYLASTRQESRRPYSDPYCLLCRTEHDECLTFRALAREHAWWCPSGTFFRLIAWSMDKSLELIEWYAPCRVSWIAVQRMQEKGLTENSVLVFPDGTKVQVIHQDHRTAAFRCRVDKLGPRTRLVQDDFGGQTLEVRVDA